MAGAQPWRWRSRAHCAACVRACVRSLAQEPAQLEAGKITISIYDANTFTRDDSAGLYEFDLAHIYYSKNHELFR